MKKFMDILKSKGFTYGTVTFIMTVSVVGILLVINIFLTNMDYKVDLTRDKRFSISKESADYIEKKVNKEVKFIVFSKQELENEIKLLLEDYQKHSKNIKIQYVDPDKNPGATKKYDSGEGVPDRTVIIECGDKWRKLSADEFFNQDFQGTVITRTEQKITGAVAYVCESKQAVLYFLQGHGEMQIQNLSIMKSSLEEDNFVNKDLNLISEGTVPENATVVAILNPKKDLSLDEKTKINKYLESGGRLLVTLEPLSNLPNIEEVLKNYNIKVDNDFVIEVDNAKVMFNYPLNLKPDIQSSEITTGIIAKNLNIIFPSARSLEIIKDDKNKVDVNSLAKTSDKSWGETNFKDSSLRKDPNDLPGPRNVVVSAEKQNADATKQKSRVIVFGDSDFMIDEAVNKMGAVGNIDLFIEMMSWLGERKDVVNISSKTIEVPSFMLTSTQIRGVLMMVIGLPLSLLGIGVIVGIRRRSL